MQLTARLAEFAVARFEATDAAQAMIRLSCLDWAACALAGRDEPVARALRAKAVAEGGREDAGLIGGGRVPARAAALVNGAIGHALDYDDTHFAHIGHPSVAVFPAALAVAERERSGLEDLLEAALLGAEVSIRVGLWLGRAHYQIGFHQTATAGAFGATVTAARLMGLSHAEAQHALALAATKAAGIKAQFGTMGKPLNAGLAAECGVMAADWARAGLRSNGAALEGVNGFGPTHHGAGDAAAFESLGQDWMFERVSHKFHACCHGLHAMLEALRDVETQPDRLVVRTHPRWMTVCNIEVPSTGLEAKFSYRMAAAMALAGLDTGRIDSFSDDVPARPDLVELMKKVVVKADERLAETEAWVEADGVTFRHDLAEEMPFDMRKRRVVKKAMGLCDQAPALQAAIDAHDIDGFLAALVPN